jgi:peroxiredoxin
MHGRWILRIMAAGCVSGVIGPISHAQPAGSPAGERPIQIGPGSLDRSSEPGVSTKVQLTADLEAKIEKLKTEYKALAGELQAIAILAGQEKAKKTAERIQKLIEIRKKAFEAELTTLEQRLNRIKKALSDSEKRQRQENRVGTSAPLFNLKDPEGKPVPLSDYKGKIVVLEWTDPDCPFWRYHADKKTMANLAASYKDKGVVWLAINSSANTSPEANKNLVNRFNLPYPILADTSGQTARHYSVTNTPQMIIVDPKGFIVYSGAIDNAPMGKAQGPVINYVDKALSEILEGKPVTTAQTRPYGSTLKKGR